MSWKPQVQVAGEGDKWHSNSLVFATKEEAEANAQNLHSRWTLTTAWRAIEVDDRPNYRWEDGRLIFIKREEAGE